MKSMLSAKLYRTTVSGLFSKRFLSYPKHEVVGMPSLSPTMTAGTVGSWDKKVGDKCSPGESVADIETDKASMAFEAQDEFFIAKILVDAGVEIPVGAPMMITVEEEEFVTAFKDYVVTPEAPAPAAETPAPKAAEVPTPVVKAPTPTPVSQAPTPVPQAPTPVPTAVVAPPAPVPVVHAPIITNEKGFYSVKYTTGNVSKSALVNKLSKDQMAYVSKYGRSAHKPLTV
mmetsp:Transcript_35945/g.34018  ORF Transcript_35945/g.34018 Transcript_35945/m.34018 type:complete len:229 (-) Transcript_35945:352-1038(-)